MPLDRDKVTVAIDTGTIQEFISTNLDLIAESDFSEFEFRRIDFSGLDLEKCNFSGCTIEECDFSKCNLYGTDWVDSRIFHTQFIGSLITDSDLSRAEVEDCDFAGAELTNISTFDTNFADCDLSRSRGVSQFILDQSVGDVNVSIPQFLDYPEHWLLSETEKKNQEWLKKLNAYRGDDVILCTFDGDFLDHNEFAGSNRTDLREALDYLQRKVKQAIEDKVFHNISPSIVRSLEDYHFLITENAGENRDRWPRKIHELEEIKIGMEGTNLISQVDACRQEIQAAFPEKVAQIDHIIQSHMLLASGLTRWKSFLHGAGETRLSDDSVSEIEAIADPICELLEENFEHVEPEIPNTIRFIKNLLSMPKDIAKRAAYGIVRCCESILSAIFSYSRRYVKQLGDDLLEVGPKMTVKLLVGGLVAVGVSKIFSHFPHLKTWLDGGLSALKSLGVLG